MLFGKSRLELKVGIFVFGALVILISFILLIGDIKTLTSGHRVYFNFHFTNGIKVGSPVRFAGVDVGEVKGVKFIHSPGEHDTKVKITGWIKRDISIPVDSTVWINTLGLLGEKYLEIMPGKDYSKCIRPEETLVGSEPVPMQEVFEMLKGVVTDLDATINKVKNKEGTIGKLLGDDAIYNELEAAIKNRDGTVGRFFYDDSVYKEVEALVKDLRAHPWKLLWKGKEKSDKK